MHHYIKAVKQLKKTLIYQLSQVIISILLIIDAQFSKIKQLSNIWWWFGGLGVVEEIPPPPIYVKHLEYPEKSDI